MSSHIVLLSYQPTSTANPALMGQIGFSDLLVTEKDNVGCHFILSLLLPIRVDQNIFFPETHLVCFISNAYKQRFSQGLQFLKNISNEALEMKIC